MEQPYDWNEDRIAALRALHESGASFSAIAAALGGVSRSAVIGKARRLGLPGRGKAVRRPEAPAPRPRGRPRKAVQRPVVIGGRSDAPAGMSGASDSLDIAFLELEPHHCRWPRGNDLPFTFCGHPRDGRSPYCPAHTKAAWLPVPPVTDTATPPAAAGHDAIMKDAA